VLVLETIIQASAGLVPGRASKCRLWVILDQIGLSVRRPLFP
jgi:hypothetical protein